MCHCISSSRKAVLALIIGQCCRQQVSLWTSGRLASCAVIEMAAAAAAAVVEARVSLVNNP
jgi:NADH:ubiquinone oxidoreductase subunit B-like Fe-S oxidoreductase